MIYSDASRDASRAGGSRSTWWPGTEGRRTVSTTPGLTAFRVLPVDG
ncbi:hypothetical protein ACFYQ5_18435 [Streptomyces sp. NPDC005794]